MSSSKVSKSFFLFGLVLLLLISFTQNSMAQTIVSGNVSGTWTVAQSPYHVTGDIIVSEKDTLIIKHGVEVFFTSPFACRVRGLLKANGKADSMIIFHGGGVAGSWKRIDFAESVKPGCLLNYCIIKDGGFGEIYGSLYTENNEANVTISNCEIYNSLCFGLFIRAKLSTNGASNIRKMCYPTITNNIIHHNFYDGIYIHSEYENTRGYYGDNNTCVTTPLIKNNIIYANVSNGIKCYTYASGAYNYHNNMNPKIQTNPRISQNTIYGNGKNGIFCSKIQKYYFGGTVIIEANPIITSNIISNNKQFGLDGNKEVSSLKIRFNDFWNNDSSHFKGVDSLLGKLTQINANGDSCDLQSNIFFDPEFVDASNYDFHLRGTSKCIDAGDLNFPLDPDGSLPDIGALPYIGSDCLLGDVTMDSLITLDDALCAFQVYLYDGIPPGACGTKCAEIASDANCDGIISPDDAVIIFQAFQNGLKPPLECPTTTDLALAKGKNRVGIIPQKVAGAPGEEVVVNIRTDQPLTFRAFGFNLGFPHKFLSFVKAKSASQTGNWQALAGRENLEGVVTIGGFRSEPAQASEIVRVTFRVKPNAQGQGDLWLFNLQGDMAGAESQAGTVSILNEGVLMSESQDIPDHFALAQNHPNPFNPNTIIQYQLPQAAQVELVIFNTLGQKIRTLVQTEQPAGYYNPEWDGRNEAGVLVPSGVYLYRLQADKFSQMKKMLLLR